MKKLTTLLMALLLVLSLAACSSNSGTEENIGAEATTVTIWTTFTKDQLEYLKKTVEDYNANNEYNTTIVLEDMPSTDFDSKLMNAIASGNGPDIVFNYASTAQNYVNDDLVIDWDQYLTKGFTDNLISSAYEESRSFSDGKMHYLPMFVSGPVFFYNADIYEELGLSAPTTWDELVANCEAVKAAYPDKYGFAADSLTDVGITLFKQTGNDVLDTNTMTLTIDTDECKQWVQWFADNVANGNFLLAPSGNYFSEDMVSTQLVSYIGSNAGAPYLEGINWGVTSLPQGAGSVTWAPDWYRGIIIFKSNEAQEAAAVKYAEYLASAEVNAGFCKAANYASPYKETIANADYQAYLATDDAKAVAALNPDIAGSFPARGYNTARNAVKDIFSGVAAGEYTVEDAFSNYIAEANASLAEE